VIPVSHCVSLWNFGLSYKRLVATKEETAVAAPFAQAVATASGGAVTETPLEAIMAVFRVDILVMESLSTETPVEAIMAVSMVDTLVMESPAQVGRLLQHPWALEAIEALENSGRSSTTFYKNDQLTGRVSIMMIGIPVVV